MALPATAPKNAPEHSKPPGDVLFLCTGNYYRSRFAEELFNHLATKASLPCRAFSLGFTPHPDINPGPISIYALHALQERGVQPESATRQPAAVQAHDFRSFQKIIALSETEHRPMMEKMFPQFLAHVEFWQAEDLAWETADSATAKIEREVRKLLESFRGATPAHAPV